MSSLNKVILIGRLGSDPEIRSTQNGKSVASFSLATTEKVGGENKTEWHKIIAWERLSDVSRNYLQKGKVVCVEGKISSREFNANGIIRKVTEIIAQNLVLLSKHEQQDISPIPHIPISSIEQLNTDSNDNYFDDIPF